jgi:type IV secretory pathway VirB10-like protein
MNRPVLVVAFVALATASLLAQESSQNSPYQGTSNPPPDDTIITDSAEQPQAKPPAGHPLNAPDNSAVPASAISAPAMQPAPRNSGANGQMGVRTDGGVGEPASSANFASSSALNDPDSDIVHPAPLGPGELREGTMIRVRLLNDLSSALSEQGQSFRSRVASDVLSGGNVVIPTGSEISGKIVEVSSGHFGGHGTLMLRPETVTLPNGESFRLHAMVASAPGTHTRVDNEGTISADSRKLRAGIEYGGAVGTGAVAGAYLGGPVGALAGSLVGAGIVTTHLLVSHPQAHLDSGDVLMLTLTERMHLVPVANTGN